jgi:glycosyltransferase involved in cell wall biosynthesis
VLYLCLEPLRPGQAAVVHVSKIAEGLGACGHDVALIASENTATSRAARLWLQLRLLAEAAGKLRNCDVVYIRSHPLALALACAARFFGKPVIHEINGKMDDLGVTYRLPRLITAVFVGMQRAQYRSAAALVAVTTGLAEWAAREVDSGMRIEVISNAADSTVFHPGATGGPDLPCDYVLFFGGLTAWHGLEVMTLAVKSPHWPPGLPLIIVGETNEATARAANNSANPRWLGRLPVADLAGLAARAFAILCPITGEGGRIETGVAPLKLFEGMASGRPVIASDLPFQAEIIRRENCGLVVPAGDAEALADAVKWLLERCDLAAMMGANGRRAVEQRHDWQHRVDATSQLIVEIAHGAAKR